MHGAPAAIRGACPACRWLSFFTRVQRQPLAHLPERCRGLSTSAILKGPRSSARTQQDDASVSFAPKGEPTENVKKQQPIPRRWQTTLQHQRLGEKKDVIIVRDAEGKKPRAPKRGDKQHGSTGQAATPQNILSMMNDTSSAPEDIQQSIALLRPSTLKQPHGRPPFITQDTLEKTLDTLCVSFTSKQLAKYLHQNLPVGHQANKGNNPRQIFSRTTEGRLFETTNWVPIGYEGVKNSKGHSRTRYALAQRIIRSVWESEVKEEIEAGGAMSLRTDSIHLTAIAEGDNAYLISELSTEQEVVINTDRASGTITLTGKKYACLEVVERLERMLQALVSVKLNFRTLRSMAAHESLQVNLERLGNIAKTYSCTLERDKSDSTLTIRGRNLADMERCQRAIVASFTHLVRRSESTITVDANRDETGSVCVISAGQKSLPYSHRHIRLGRLSTSFKVEDITNNSVPGSNTRLQQPRLSFLDKSKTVHTALLGKESTTPTQVQNKYVSLLVPSAEYSHDSLSLSSNITTRRFAEVGHILHEMNGTDVVRSVKVKDLCTDTLRPGFVPHLGGLPQFMHANVLEANRSDAHRLRILLIPSPWAFKGFHEQQKFPPLEMTLEFTDYKHGTLVVESLAAVIDHRILNVMLPSSGQDVRFHCKNLALCENAENSSAVAEFVKEIAGTAHGYGTIRAPLTLDVPVPTWAISDPKRKATEAQSSGSTVPVQYFATGVEYDESQTYRYKDQDLVIRQIGGGDFGITAETIQLYCRDSDAEPDEPLVQGFMSATSQLVQELSAALGNMRMMTSNPKSADNRLNYRLRYNAMYGG